MSANHFFCYFYKTPLSSCLQNSFPCFEFLWNTICANTPFPIAMLHFQRLSVCEQFQRMISSRRVISQVYLVQFIVALPFIMYIMDSSVTNIWIKQWEKWHNEYWLAQLDEGRIICVRVFQYFLKAASTGQHLLRTCWMKIAVNIMQTAHTYAPNPGNTIMLRVTLTCLAIGNHKSVVSN